MRLRPEGCHFADNIFKWICLNVDYCNLIQISLKFVPKGPINTLRPRQNGRHFAGDTLNRIFLKENVRISIKISLKFAPKSPIYNIPTLFQIMAWHRPGDKPSSEAMMVSLLTHICVARTQWVNIMPVQVQTMDPCWTHWQAIIWINDGLVYWCTPLSLNALTTMQHEQFANNISNVFTCQNFSAGVLIIISQELIPISPIDSESAEFWAHNALWNGSLNNSSPFYWYGLTLIPAWISNHTPGKVWDEITYPFLNFNGATVEV